MTVDAKARIDLANEYADIVDVCHEIGVDAPSIVSGSIKLYCPFGEINHSDGGRSRGFRLYPDHAYCFACGTYYTPVVLWAKWKGIPEEDAAEYLLEKSGYREPDPVERITEYQQNTFRLDRDEEANALKVFCRRIAPDWRERQFDESVGTMLTRCLKPLSKVASDDELQRWRTTTRAAMRRVLNGEKTP